MVWVPQGRDSNHFHLNFLLLKILDLKNVSDHHDDNKKLNEILSGKVSNVRFAKNGEFSLIYQSNGSNDAALLFKPNRKAFPDTKPTLTKQKWSELQRNLVDEKNRPEILAQEYHASNNPFLSKNNKKMPVKFDFKSSKRDKPNASSQKLNFRPSSIMTTQDHIKLSESFKESLLSNRLIKEEQERIRKDKEKYDQEQAQKRAQVLAEAQKVSLKRKQATEVPMQPKKSKIEEILNKSLNKSSQNLTATEKYHLPDSTDHISFDVVNISNKSSTSIINDSTMSFKSNISASDREITDIDVSMTSLISDSTKLKVSMKRRKLRYRGCKVYNFAGERSLKVQNMNEIHGILPGKGGVENFEEKKLIVAGRVLLKRNLVRVGCA